MKTAALLGLAGSLLVVASAAAQVVTPTTPGRPGPWVIDVRGATIGIPSAVSFYPDLAADASIAARGYGLDAGGHIYLLQLGGARVGVGASVLFGRGTSPHAIGSVGTVVPQLSLNFGTADGWSYLSAGLGPARIRAERRGPAPGGDAGADGEEVVPSDPVRETRSRSINVGGGARWFLSPHFGIGFDVRMHMVAAGDATPSATLVSASVGLSLK